MILFASLRVPLRLQRLQPTPSLPVRVRLLPRPSRGWRNRTGSSHRFNADLTSKRTRHWRRPALTLLPLLVLRRWRRRASESPSWRRRNPPWLSSCLRLEPAAHKTPAPWILPSSEKQGHRAGMVSPLHSTPKRHMHYPDQENLPGSLNAFLLLFPVIELRKRHSYPKERRSNTCFPFWKWLNDIFLQNDPLWTCFSWPLASGCDRETESARRFTFYGCTLCVQSCFYLIFLF